MFNFTPIFIYNSFLCARGGWIVDKNHYICPTINSMIK